VVNNHQHIIATLIFTQQPSIWVNEMASAVVSNVIDIKEHLLSNMHRNPDRTDIKKSKGDPSRGDMSDTLSEAALAYQKRVKAGKLATKSVAPVFATDSRNFDSRGLQAERRSTTPLNKNTTSRDRVSPTRGRVTSEDKDKAATIPQSISKTNSGRERADSTSRARAGSKDRVTSTTRDRPPTHPPSNRPPLKKSPSRSKVTSPDRPSTPTMEHNVDRLLINTKLMKESLRDFLDVDKEFSAAVTHQDPSDDPAIFEALWVVKRGVEELAVAKARLHTLEALLRDSKAMQVLVHFFRFFFFFLI
jgi:hypothetical protein